MADKIQEQIWNQFDEFGLLVGIPRIPGQTNASYRRRLIDHEPYDSTIQGLTNFLSDSLLVSTGNLQGKLAFASIRQPLSLAKYQELMGTSDGYYAPRVVVGANTWTAVPGALVDRDVTNTISGTTWTLWKQPDGSYDRIWTVNVEQEENIELLYSWVNRAGEVVKIRETATLDSWDNGVIVEVDPDE